MPSHASLDAAAQDRKSRLAKLKSLKRKAPSSEDDASETLASPSHTQAQDASSTPAVPPNPYLSGRNYDPETRNAKLGFEFDPSADKDTAERRAQELAEAERAQREEDDKEAEAKPLDLFKLQPKKANWDLKRDVERRMERLNVQTENAIARLVRERVGAQQKRGSDEGEEAGLKGEELVSALHAKEALEREEERREREEDELEEDGFKEDGFEEDGVK